MKARSISGKKIEEIRGTLEATIAAGFKPTLAVVFLSVKIDREEVISCLNQFAIQIFGATTHGEFIDENVGKESIAMLLLDLDPAYFHIHLEEYPDLDFRGAGNRAAQESIKHIGSPGFLMAGSHLATDPEQLLGGIIDMIGEEVSLFGGMAGDDLTLKEQFVFSHQASSNQGVILLALDSKKVKIAGRALCGWKAVGTEKVVTRSDGNHLYTIENIPTLDMLAKYGGLRDPTPENANLLLEIGALYPLQLLRENAPPVIRPSLVVDWDDHSTYTSGYVPQGSKVRFCIPPDFDAIEEVIEGCRDLRDTDLKEADAVVYFSCAGRLMTFGPLMEQEISGIKEVWGAPIVGMFSNAEFGRAKGGSLELHNLTSCCVAIKEID